MTDVYSTTELPSNDTEVWKAIPGYEGRYEVSNWARVRALFTVRHLPQLVPGRILKPYHQKTGYYYNVLTDGHGGKTAYRLHRLMWMAFVGPIPDGEVVRHWDGNVEHNRLSNFRCGTQRENIEDEIRHGTFIRGERQWAAKFTVPQIKDIRRRLAQGEKQTHLAKEYGVTQGCIHLIHAKKNWSHIL